MDQTTPPSYTADELSTMHQALVDIIVHEHPLSDPSIEAAFRAVPRHLFLPGVDAAKVYTNEAIVTHWKDERMPISSSTQPALMAMMIEQLDLQPGHRVLEIGTATGYNAAILRHIVGDSGAVVSMDIDEELVSNARRHLASAGVNDVHTVTGDGGHGWSDEGPYDRILVTVGSPDIPPAWKEQLTDDGRLVVPLALFKSFQRSIAFVKRGDVLESVSQHNCGFIYLRGEFSAPDVEPVLLGDIPKIVLVPEQDDPSSVDGDAIYELLKGSYIDYPTEVSVTERAIFFRLMPRFSLRIPHLFFLIAAEEAYNEPTVPLLLDRRGEHRAVVGAFADGGLGIVTRAPDVHVSPEAPDSNGTETAETAPDEPPSMTLHVRSYGSNDEPARELLAEITTWQAQGRSKLEENFKVLVYPKGTVREPGDGEIVIEKPNAVVVVATGNRIQRVDSDERAV